MKAILVAGGDGFIGKNLVKKLLGKRIPVVVIDNNISSFPQDIQDPLFFKIKADVSNLDQDIVPETSGVVHLASIASPLIYKKNPQLVLEANTLGTKNLIEIAKRDNVRLLYASSSEVYGNVSRADFKNGINEKAEARINLLTERSCYSAAKRLGEELILEYRRRGGKATNLRFFNIYGSGMDSGNLGYGRVIPNFMNSFAKGLPLTIFGNGEQVRSFLWIEDAIEAIYGILFFPGDLPVALNIGNEETTTIKVLAEKMAKIFDADVEVKNCQRDFDDPIWRKPNIDLLKSLISWEPKISLEQGLKKLLEEER